MGGFVQLIPNPLTQGDTSLSGEKPDYINASEYPKWDHVRRNVRGLQVKEDTYATLEVKTLDGRSLLMVDSGGKIDKGDVSYGPKNSNFLLQNVSFSSSEKCQIVETFGPTFAFFYGTRPKMLSASGILLNSADFNWKNEFFYNYDNFLRGTQLVSNNTIAYLSYDDVTVSGYLMTTGAEQSADPNELVSFSFQMLVSSIVPTNIVGYNMFPYNTPVNLEPDIVVLPASETPGVQDTLENTGANNYTNFLEGALKGSINLDFAFGLTAQSYTNFTINYITGANMRTPIGYEGSILFDNQPVKYRYGSTITSYKVNEVKYGKIRDNLDEYVAKGKVTSANSVVTMDANDVLKAQYKEGQKIKDIARKEFKKYNINPDPPNEFSRLARSGAFAAVQLAGRLTLPGSGFLESNAKNNIDDSTVTSIADRTSR